MAAKDYYVYVLYRETGAPFYVGMSRDPKRWHSFPPSSRAPRDVIAKECCNAASAPGPKRSALA